MSNVPEHEGVEGQVVRYTSERRDRHCREGMAISDHNGRFLDTFWGSGMDAHVLTTAEEETAEHLFWMDEYDELDRYARNSPAVWETYAPADRQRITHQHGLQSRWFIRKGAQPDLPTQVENAREALRAAAEDERMASLRVRWAGEKLDALLARERGEQ